MNIIVDFSIKSIIPGSNQERHQTTNRLPIEIIRDEYGGPKAT